MKLRRIICWRRWHIYPRGDWNPRFAELNNLLSDWNISFSATCFDLGAMYLFSWPPRYYHFCDIHGVVKSILFSSWPFTVLQFCWRRVTNAIIVNFNIIVSDSASSHSHRISKVLNFELHVLKLKKGGFVRNETKIWTGKCLHSYIIFQSS
jgi:hypothetical protein